MLHDKMFSVRCWCVPTCSSMSTRLFSERCWCVPTCSSMSTRLFSVRCWCSRLCGCGTMLRTVLICVAAPCPPGPDGPPNRTQSRGSRDLQDRGTKSVWKSYNNNDFCLASVDADFSLTRIALESGLYLVYSRLGTVGNHLAHNCRHIL